MSRRARLTILERGASSTAWATCPGLGADDDWVVIAQQHDESTREFAERVRQRARKLRKHASIESIDLYIGPPNEDAGSGRSRRLAIVALGRRVATGGRLTVWSGARGADEDSQLAAILAHYGPLLAKRQVAMNHQVVELEERSGVRHAVPTRGTPLPHEVDDELDVFGFVVPE